MKKKMSKKKSKEGHERIFFSPFVRGYGTQSSNQLCSLIQKIFKNQDVTNEDYKVLFKDTKFNEFLDSTKKNEDLFKNLKSILDLSDDELRQKLSK